MRIAVIGLGSMGKRRIRLIRKYQETIAIVGVDTNKERRDACKKEYGIETYANLADLIDSNNIDCAFICTSPLSHSKIITLCLKNHINVFTELNLVDDDYEVNIKLAKQNNLILFLSSTFLYRSEIKKIKTLVLESKNLLNYTYHVGQYLPDWHPWENYKDFFVGNKRSNGCREIFAIELPWLIDVFGNIRNVEVIKSKMSNLNIDYNDNYLLLIQHETGCKGVLVVDIISRKAVRNLEVFGENLYLNWNGTPEGLSIYDFETKNLVNLKLYEEVDQLKNYSSFIVENAYLNEIISFFESVTDAKVPVYSFEKDKEILKIIDKIEA